MPTIDISRHADLAAVPAFMLGSLEFGRNRLLAAMKDLTPEQLAKVPAGYGNSIATLALHIAATEVSFAHRIMGKPMTAELEAEYPKHLAGTPLPAPAPETTAAELTARLEKSRGILAEALAALSEADLAREIPMGPDRSATVGWMLAILLGHQSQHYGHIQMIAKLV
ncbi:MAG TPA: DinB family protein [Symbiobacteriaceae bacterium]|nr:DinB family protein [Symbiobacteriaceae bacterium]